MAFKGSVPAGSKVTATLVLDGTASGPTILTIGYGRSGGGGSEKDGDVVNPGGSESVSVQTDSKGVLKVIFDMSSNGDTGTLTVTADGSEVISKPIKGDDVWAFSVKP